MEAIALDKPDSGESKNSTKHTIEQNPEHLMDEVTVSHQTGSQQRKNTELNIRYAEDLRFEKPVPTRYAKAGAIGSIGSLLLMSLLSTLMYVQLGSTQPVWVHLPFLFTIIGSTLGWVFELGLLLSGTPFAQDRNAFTRFIRKLRLLNLAPVSTTILFFVCAMVIADPNLRMAALYLAGAGCFGLGAALFFGGAQSVPLVLLGMQVAQAMLVLSFPHTIGGTPVMLCLLGQAACQFSALLIGTSTPNKSTAFHLISTLSGVLLFAAFTLMNGADPDFARQMAPVLPTGSLLLWGFVLTCLAGLVFTMKASPMTYSNFRAGLSNSLWSAIYYQLISARRFPEPRRLDDIYSDAKEPVLTPLEPYSRAHLKKLPESLNIPAVPTKDIEGSVKSIHSLFRQAINGFRLIRGLDRHLPQANVTIHLANKPRMPEWSDGSNYWPGLFQHKIFGHSMPNNGRKQKTPEPVLQAFKEGQLIAYLSESGIFNTFVKAAPEHGEGMLVADFRYLQRYATKADYEGYGGMALLKVNSEQQRLQLVAVIAPNSDQKIAANPADPSFRRAEQLVLASAYFAVISGKHLGEIHMTLNLVEVCMHNAFDAQGQWNHPLRSFMYLHFFSHELAEEITTEHLIQEGAVFNQIFATTHAALIDHLNDCYANFEFGTDEDFAARKAAMTMADGELLPKSCVKWELDYFTIWQRYTNDLINIIYADDDAVRADRYLQDFYAGLQQVMVQGLPARYHGFQTRDGVARFAADTIHHCVVRHQVYGTTGIKAALDPRISTTQVPRDSGTPGIDEWRSLACVAMATGEARFTLLAGPHGKDYTYLLKGLDKALATPMAEVFDRMQRELKELDRLWTADASAVAFNDDYFRPLPSALHTGPGY